MALIQYPNVGYDAFITLDDMNSYMENYSPRNASWVSVDVADREKLIRISTQYLIDGIEDITVLTDPLQACVEDVIKRMVDRDFMYNISSSLSTTQQTQSEMVGTLRVSYFENKAYTSIVSRIPPNVSKCLDSIGYVQQPCITRLKQIYLGRS